jgi:glycosyltransferase involved in cell wall biosynthesis
MRIAYVCADRGVPIFGNKGCSIHVRQVISALLRHGAEIDLIAAGLDGERPANWGNVRIHLLPLLSSTDPREREQMALAGNEHTMAALRKSGGFDMVYERYSLWSYAAMEYATLTGTSGVLEVNAPLVEEQAEHRVLIDRAAAEGVARRVFAAADALVAVSKELADYLNSYPGARGRVHVIPNGVDPARFPENIRPSLPNPKRLFTIGFVGSMKPWHGLPSLLAAFDQVRRSAPDTRLLIVGNGKAKEELQSAILDRGLEDSIHFTGAVDSEKIPELLASMDVAVAPYPALANFYFSPLKVYEYMAAGRAVVASRIGSLIELIEDGVSGLLSPPGDGEALAAAILRLKADAALRQRLGAAARKMVIENYTWDQVVRRTTALATRRPLEADLTMEAAS